MRKRTACSPTSKTFSRETWKSYPAFRQVVIWEPSMTKEKISWRCIGGPPKGVAPECR